MPKRTDSTPTRVADEPSLADWLKQHRARLLWSTSPDRARASVHAYSIRGALVLVMLLDDGRGWDIFTSSGSLNIDRTLDDANERIGR